ncbi:DNA polymerase, partial [Candidatus Woesearchaeota archaeon]|nr:DNA polymerase [Candidatus Woesearchaeota archaeon]
VEKRRRMRPYQGGYVKEPKIGLHDDIAVFDFRSLYPSIIVTYNLSPETFGCGHKEDKAKKVPGMKHYFCSKVKGFIPTHLKSIIEQRLAIKNEMSKHAKGSPQYKQLDEEQKAIKILANATYGYMAYAGSRWYSREAAESAAAYGRYHVQKIIAEAEKEGFDVLYADTDSVFVKLKTKDKTENKMMKQNRGQRQNEGIDETEKTLGKKSKDIESAAEKFHSKINKALPGILELELQGIYKRGLFVPQKLGTYTAKKRYALIDGKGEVTVRGFEAVRRDWCDLSKQLQHEVLRLVLKGKEKEAVAKVRDVVKRVKERRVTIDEISIRTMLGKELDEYKATGPHIAVAKKLKEEGHDMPMGTVISYVITKSSGAKESISSRAKPSDKVGVKDYDVDYYLENQILAVALRVLQVLGYTAEEFG